MNNSNFIQTVPNSQFYDSLEQIKWAIQRLQHKAIEGLSQKTFDEFKYVIKGIENTMEKYNLVEKS